MNPAPLERAANLLVSRTDLGAVIVLAFALLLISVVSFGTSLICTIRILKVWPYARLSAPLQIAMRAQLMDSEAELIRAITGNHVWATGVNHGINNKKAKLLSLGSFYMTLGMVTFVLSLLASYTFTAWKGLGI